MLMSVRIHSTKASLTINYALLSTFISDIASTGGLVNTALIGRKQGRDKDYAEDTIVRLP